MLNPPRATQNFEGFAKVCLRLGMSALHAAQDAQIAKVRRGPVMFFSQIFCLLNDGLFEIVFRVLQIALSKIDGRHISQFSRQRTGQLMYELSLRYPAISGLPAKWSWPLSVATTVDGLPWIGPHRNYPFHFFAIAFGSHGEALAWFAAKAALRHFTGNVRREDAVFGFARG